MVNRVYEYLDSYSLVYVKLFFFRQLQSKKIEMKRSEKKKSIKRTVFLDLKMAFDHLIIQFFSKI